MGYDIFISYKRLEASSPTAAYLYRLLQDRGYNVFFDQKEMRTGKFNEQLLEHIQNAAYIMILLEKNSLRSWFDHRMEGVESGDDDGDYQEPRYKTDWFCKEIMHALSLKKNNIIPVLLNGYSMPEEKDLPPEMRELSLFQAFSLNVSDAPEFVDDKLVGNALKSLPTHPSFMRKAQGKSGVVGRFLFYTEAKSCELSECGVSITTLTDDYDEGHPYSYLVDFAGKHLFRVVNNDSCEVVTITSSVGTFCQEYVHVQFSDTRDLWKLTKKEINAQKDADLLLRWGVGLFKGTSQHQPDFALSFECLQRAIRLGSQEALSFIADIVGDPIDSQVPPKVAFQWYQIAAEQGNLEAMVNLGRAYYRGKGVKQDDAKALEWYTKAAEQGFPCAQSILGTRYRKGQGVEQDYGKALEWYTKASEQGYAVAQRYLGNLYRDGLGVERDYGKALEWYTKAAEQGYAPAQCNIGLMYRKGLGVKQDYEKALEWFFKAAEQKEKRSINAIAWTYHLIGDYEKALPWAEQALAVNPAQAYVVDTVATVYEGLGRYDEALEQFEKCLRMYEEKGDELGKQRTADKIEALKEKMNRK